MSHAETPPSTVLELTSCSVDLTARTAVHHDGSTLSLTERECALLAYLAASMTSAVPRSELLEKVWHYAPTVRSRAVDNTVVRLREKIEPNTERPVHLVTVHGVGYRLALGVGGAANKRQARPERAGPRVLHLRGATVDLGTSEVHRGGSSVPLSHKELALLLALHRGAGAIVDPRTLLREVWQGQGSDRGLRVAMGRLRQKIEADPSHPEHLLNVRGQGYRLVLHAAPDAMAGPLVVVQCAMQGTESLWSTVHEHMPEAIQQLRETLEECSSEGRLGGSDGDRVRYVFEHADAALRWCIAAQSALLVARWPAEVLDRPEAAEVRSDADALIFRGPRVAMAVCRGHLVPGETNATYIGAPVEAARRRLRRCPGGWLSIDDSVWSGISEVHRQDVLALVSSHGRRLVLPRALQGREAWGVGNTPRQFRRSFVGRGGELEQLRRWLAQEERPSCTLLGPGGAGKSTLARRFVERLDMAVWWCNLDQASNEQEMWLAMGEALGVASPTPARVGRVLQARGGGLVVLDSLERLRDPASSLDKMLAQAPALRCLLTSRRQLGLRRESLVAVGPLDAEAALQLFADRALGRAREELVADPAIEQLVERLDRLPLAVELAAARTDVLSPGQLLERMDVQQGLLRQDGEGRHTTLTAAIDWSWDLMGEWERTALRQLAVFRSGFDLADAEAVLDLGSDAPDAAHVMRTLVDHSLVHSARVHGGQAPGELEFRLLETMRAYARKRLQELSPEVGDRAMLAMTRWVARLGADSAVAALYQPSGPELVKSLLAQRANLVACALWAADRGMLDEAVHCLSAAGEVMLTSGRGAELVALVERVGAQPAIGVQQRARLLYYSGYAHTTLGDAKEAERHLQEAWTLAEPGVLRIRVGTELAQLVRLTDRPRAAHILEACQRMCDALNDLPDHRLWRGKVLSRLAQWHAHQAQRDKAIEVYRQALAIHREVGNRRDEALARSGIGRELRFLGRPKAAINEYDVALYLHKQLGNIQREGYLQSLRGDLYYELGRLPEARECKEEAARCHLAVGNLDSYALNQAALAAVHAKCDDMAASKRAERLALSTDANLLIRKILVRINLMEAAFVRRDAESMLHYAEWIMAHVDDRTTGWIEAVTLRMAAEALAMLGRFDQAEVRAVKAEVQLRKHGPVPEHTLCLVLLGRLALRRDDRALADRLLGEANDLVLRLGQGQHNEPWQAVQDLTVLLGGSV